VVGATLGDAAGDVEFSFRELVHRCRGRAAGRGELSEEPDGDRWRDEGVAGAGGADGFDEQGGSGVFEQEADRAGLERAVDVLVGVVWWVGGCW
jgi:hypothetical protein